MSPPAARGRHSLNGGGPGEDVPAEDLRDAHGGDGDHGDDGQRARPRQEPRPRYGAAPLCAGFSQRAAVVREDLTHSCDLKALPTRVISCV